MNKYYSKKASLAVRVIGPDIRHRDGRFAETGFRGALNRVKRRLRYYIAMSQEASHE